jgi:outer membrane protein
MTGEAIALALTIMVPPPAEPIPPPVLEAPVPSEPVQAAPAEPRAPSRWYGRVGGVAAFYHPGARVSLGGREVPNSSVDVSTDTGVTFDIGYDLSDHLSVQLMFGVPPRPSITGERAIASLGELGQVRYGPVILTGLYRLPRLGPVRPYVGAGAAYALIFKAHDGSVSDLRVHNDWGFVLQAGAEIPVGRRLALFADVKRIWLSVDADGTIAGGIPVDARVRLDPVLVSAGLRLRFR